MEDEKTKPVSVLEMNKDLIEETAEKKGKKKGIDWGWGGDDDASDADNNDDDDDNEDDDDEDDADDENEDKLSDNDNKNDKMVVSKDDDDDDNAIDKEFSKEKDDNEMDDECNQDHDDNDEDAADNKSINKDDNGNDDAADEESVIKDDNDDDDDDDRIVKEFNKDNDDGDDSDATAEMMSEDEEESDDNHSQKLNIEISKADSSISDDDDDDDDDNSSVCTKTSETKEDSVVSDNASDSESEHENESENDDDSVAPEEDSEGEEEVNNVVSNNDENSMVEKDEEKEDDISDSESVQTSNDLGTSNEPEEEKSENHSGEELSSKTLGSDAMDTDKPQQQDEETNKDKPLEVQEKESAPEATGADAELSKDEIRQRKLANQPDMESLIHSTDFLFAHADKKTVTVADVCRALEAEYDCKLSKPNRKKVRAHLVDLMMGNVLPSVENDIEEDAGQEEEESVFGQAEESESEASEYEDNPQKKNRRRKPPTKKKIPKPKMLSKRKTAKAAQLIEARRLRKKRIEELRVRNEEMQLDQSREEKERAEAIAARFETNTDELLAQRLEDRLNLLQALDKKRITVVELSNVVEEKPAQKKDEETAKESESEEESSDEEEDLEIVGAAKPIKPLAPIHTHFQSSALDILKKLRSPDAKQQKAKMNISPGTKSLNKRNTLRMALKQKQRLAGNRWLARELGYKTEEEHLRDCQALAQQKREQVIKLEQMRMKANERKQLRERFLLEDAPQEDSEEVEFSPNESPKEEEENEELQLAREIEQEQSQTSPPMIMPKTSVDEEETTQVTAEEAEIIQTEIEEITHTAEDSSSESQRLETQPPLDGPIFPKNSPGVAVRVVSEEKSNIVAESQSTDSNVLEQDERNDSDIMPPPTSVEYEIVEKNSQVEAESGGDESMDALQKPVSQKDPNKPRNAGWQAMLRKEAEKLKKQKKRRKAGDLIEAEAEEEEEEAEAGLEDFGFSIQKKKKEDDEDPVEDELNEEDLKHVVDELSDDEGDEEAGQKARKRQEQLEEKEKHKEMLRRMRDGYDGRRGGVAGGGAGARGIHRFDQLVAADNREDAKRLGLLNDDELDSDDEKPESNNQDDEEDETALLDKMLKDRFLHRSNVELEENFSDSEGEGDSAVDKGVRDESEDEEERTQERLAKRFAKRARMQRLEEMFADSQEFSQQRLIDEDQSMKIELQSMKNGLVRKRSVSSSRSSFSDNSANLQLKRQRSGGSFGGSFMDKGASLSVALRASRKPKQRTSFLGGGKVGEKGDTGGLIHRSVSLSHVVFPTCDSRSASKTNTNPANATQKVNRKRKDTTDASSTFFGKVAGRGQ